MSIFRLPLSAPKALTHNIHYVKKRRKRIGGSASPDLAAYFTTLRRLTLTKCAEQPPSDAPPGMSILSGPPFPDPRTSHVIRQRADFRNRSRRHSRRFCTNAIERLFGCFDPPFHHRPSRLAPPADTDPCSAPQLRLGEIRFRPKSPFRLPDASHLRRSARLCLASNSAGGTSGNCRQTL